MTDETLPVPTGASRLLAAVETLPLRYAPFFDALTTLWDLSEPEVMRTLRQAGDPSTWPRAALPGVRLVTVVPGPRLRGAVVRLARFRPGLRFPRHRHDGPETLLVLEGRYEDETGRAVGPGERHEMPAGSEHALRVERAEPCVVATVQFGMQFSDPLLRALSRLFG
jgi:anti-sigma factor ChrR (cupin superfamily)